MNKKMKVLVGLCLAAVLAIGGAGRYAQAETNYVTVPDIYGRMHTIRGTSTIGRTSGTAYTEAEGSSSCYCTVSATFTWYDSNLSTLYSNGNSAGGMHGAAVSISYPGDVNAVASAYVSANHTVKVTDGSPGSCTTSDSW